MYFKKLRLNAFGPYKNNQEIDFDMVNDKKLFLITGPTGSGKTSIFDAISYALYGEASGDGRISENFISHFAEADDVTYVDLEFDIKGKTYNIYREPRQMKKKLRGEGYTEKGPIAKLELPNGKIIVGSSEVSNEIQKILGITNNQFKQIVMLPQGEFRKLLEASSIQREDIFRRIFKTDMFKKFQDLLKEKTKELDKEIGLTNNIIYNNVEKLIFTNDELKSLVCAQYKNISEIINNGKKQVEVDSKELTILNEKIANEEKKVLKFEQEINEVNNINKLFKQRDEHNSRLMTLDKELFKYSNLEIKVGKAHKALVLSQIEIQIDKLKLELNNNQDKSSKLKIKLTRLLDKLAIKEKVYNEYLVKKENSKNLEEELYLYKEKLNKYENYNIKTELCKKLEIDSLNSKKRLNELSSKLENLKSEIDIINKDYNNLKDVENKLNEMKLQKQNNEIEVKEIQAIVKICCDIIDCSNSHHKLSESYKSINEQYNEVKSLYEEKFDLFRKGQAGLLASTLEDNLPCPVCGATKHPNKAELLDDVLSEKQLDELKDKLTIYEANNHKTYQKVKEKYLEVKQLEKNLVSYKESIDINCDRIEYQEKLEFYQESLNLSLKKLDDTLNELKVLNNKNKLRKKFEENINLLNEDYKLVETNYNLDKEEFIEINKKHEIEKSILEVLKKDLFSKFSTIELLKEKINEITNELEMLNNGVKYATKEVLDVKNNIIELESDLKNLAINEEMLIKNVNSEQIKFNDMLNISLFNDLDDYKECLITEDEIKQFELAIKNYYEEKNYLIKTIENLKETLKDRDVVDVTKLVSKQEEIKGYLIELRKTEKETHSIIQNNNNVILEVEKLYKKVKSKIDEFNVLSDISKAANGINVHKLTFERYVLAAYFDEIIYAANNRLANMTSNRYMLIRKEESKGSSQQGLDLEVLDNYTSKTRNVKTLSGGEAFIASLALALGLADVIQSYSGGIELDTIFIDEGFGALDPESLELAIETLINIQNSGRLVGIISHVEELKERIDVKLEIIPSKKGSSAKFVI